MSSWWSTGERRGPEWKQGWRGQTFSSLSLPPAPLLVIFAIVSFFLWLSWDVDYEIHKRHAKIGFHLLLAVFIIGLVLAARYVWWDQYGRFARRPLFWSDQEAVQRSEGSPWGVAAVVLLLLVLVSYQSNFQSHWFRPLWRSY